MQKVSPLLFDSLTTAEQNFLSDWKNYCKKFNSWEGIKNIIYIGNVSGLIKTQAETILNPEMLKPAIQQNVQIEGANTFDLAANIADYFWYSPDTVIMAPIAENFPAPQSSILNYSNSLPGIGWINKSGEINTTYLTETWSKSDLTINSGAILIQINNTNDLALELLGNYSETIPWMYDTNKLTKNNWVFFPNVTYPADVSDWGLRVLNTTEITAPIPFDVAFYNLTYQTHQFEITNSEGLCQISLNWSDPSADLKFWVLDPTGQLVGASSRTIFDTGVTNGSSTILYPTIGNWSVIVTRIRGSSAVPYNLTINITESSSYKRQCIESAANGAIIASQLNKPLLYVTNSSVPNETKRAISTLNASKVICVDPYNLITTNVTAELATLGINLTESTNLTSKIQLYDYIYNLTQQSDLVLSSINNGYFAPASLMAAYKGAPLLFTLNESYNIHAGALKNYAMDSWVGFQDPGNSGLLNQSIPRFEDMKGLADNFYAWMNSINRDKSGTETVLVVSPIWELNTFFDRAIFGKALVGRFATLDSEDLAVSICRNIFYPVLSYTNMSYGYSPRTKLISVGGNLTITSTQLYASSYSGDYTACKADDGVYHSYLNGSNGQVVIPYYVNLSESQIHYNNISQVEITIDGKIAYSNASIQVAGWGIWNWTSANMVLLNTQFLNSTSDQTATILINTTNKTSLILSTNSRIELFVLVNTTGAPINVSIDFIEFNVTYNYIKNQPLMLSSSVTYWHDFSFQGTTYNYSSLIPLNFTQNGFVVVNSTGSQEVFSQLLDDCKLWYYSGNNTLNETLGEWNMLFTQSDYWRAYGDYSDDQGSTPDNPDADADHYVTANTTLEDWQTRTELFSVLTHLPSTFVMLQEDYGALTLVPEYLMSQGATTVVADLKQNSLGYSEHFSYLLTNALLQNKPIGEALLAAFNATSHLYSEDWEGSIIGTAPFSNYTEESQAFVLYGDPELSLINSTYDLVRPTSYRPLIQGFSNITRRTGFVEILYPIYQSYPAIFWANITDIDSYLKTEVSARYNITGTQYGTHESFEPYQTNQGTLYDDQDDIFVAFTVFYNTSLSLFESLTRKTVEWHIFDSSNEIQIAIPIYLRSALPNVVDASKTIQLNDTGIFNDIDHVGPLVFHETIGRVNESIYVEFNVTDVDQVSGDPDSSEFEVNLVLQNVDTNTTGFAPMNFVDDNNGDDIVSIWNITYSFNAFNDTGKYELYAQVTDGENETKLEYLDYIFLINWAPEANGTNFVITNGTAPENQVFRENETIEFFASVLDVDGSRNVTESCEGNGTITGTQLSAINFTGNTGACQLNDGVYHTYHSNTSGQIVWSYFVNMSDYGINYNTTSRIEVSIDGKLGYSNGSVELAGWGLWNWSSGKYIIMNSSVLNSTTDNFDSVVLANSNLSDFLNPAQKSRIELFILVNTSGPVVNVSIDLIQFRITFKHDMALTHDVMLCLYKETNQWINVSMTDNDLNNNWTATYTFTRFNESGKWIPYVNVFDRDGPSVLFNSGINVTVVNHLPDIPTNVTITDFNLTVISSILRNNTIRFFGNATDFDVDFRTSTLILYACLNDSAGIVRYQEVMTYNSNMSLWSYNFTPLTTDPVGNWTYYVSVVDEAGGRTNSSGIMLTIINNQPIIQVVEIQPADLELFIGEDLSINITATDVEKLTNATVFIEDGTGTLINMTGILINQSDSVIITFIEANYSSLDTSGTWNITIRLYDAEGDYSSEFTFPTGNNSITIIVHPRQQDNGGRFPFEVIIIIAIVIITVMATYLVYRIRKKEAAVVPAARVRQIIKKISKEKDTKVAETRAEIESRIKAIDIKPKPKIKILPEEKKELSEEEIENLNKEMRKLVKEAQDLLENAQFEAASIAYHDASTLALKLEKNEIAKVYANRSEEILARKSELKKKAKQEAKVEKKLLKEKQKKKIKLSRAEIENIKTEIGEIMRSARRSINQDDYISAAKQYREVSELYSKIGDEEKANEFEEKADSLL